MFWTETALPAKCVGPLRVSPIRTTPQERQDFTLGTSLTKVWVELMNPPIFVQFAQRAMKVHPMPL